MSDDITHCSGGDCPLREDCYRFRAEVFGRFDAFGRPPYDAATGRCAHHWPLSRLRPTAADVQRRAYFLWVREGRPDGRADEHWAAASAALDAEFARRLRAT